MEANFTIIIIIISMNNYLLKEINLLIAISYILLLSGSSCSKPQERGQKEFNLQVSQETLNLSKYFSKISITNLKSEGLIGTIDKIIIDQEHTIISDFYIMKSLKTFDKNGNLQASRDDIGEGPFGLSEISDFDIFQDTIYVLDAHKRKIMRFTLDLESLDEFDVPIPCNNFIINNDGIFILRQGLDAEKGRIVQFSHQMKFIKPILPTEDINTQIVVSSSNLFTELNDSTFVFTHPFYPNLWIYENGKVGKIDLNFNREFLDVSEVSKMNPLDRLHFVNEFNGFYNIANGIKLSDNEMLFSIRYRKRDGYLKLNLQKMQMIYIQNIKNDLNKVPSTITFSGNSNRKVWYWMDQHDIAKFYSLNNSKIPNEERIKMSNDNESKIIFELEYR